MDTGNSRFKCGCDLTRGTRGKTHPLSAFKVAHLAAGGNVELNRYFFLLFVLKNPSEYLGFMSLGAPSCQLYKQGML